MGKIDNLTDLFSVSRYGSLYYDGEKPETPGVALALSEAKWEVIAEKAVIEDGGRTTCGLCMLYYDDNCGGCPIAEYTHTEYCHDTPYYEWIENKTKSNAKKELRFIRKVKKHHGKNHI